MAKPRVFAQENALWRLDYAFYSLILGVILPAVLLRSYWWASLAAKQSVADTIEVLASPFAAPQAQSAVDRIIFSVFWVGVGALACYLLWLAGNILINIRNTGLVIGHYANRPPVTALVLSLIGRTAGLVLPLLWLFICLKYLGPAGLWLLKSAFTGDYQIAANIFFGLGGVLVISIQCYLMLAAAALSRLMV